MKRLLQNTIFLCLIFNSSISLALPVQWSTANGGNGHWYEIVLEQGLTWFSAKDNAANMTHLGQHGHLATLTSSSEQEFLLSTFGGGIAINQLWLGGYQDTSVPNFQEPNDGWTWITGEEWNTGLDQPRFSFNNDSNGHTEEHLITWWNNGGINDLYHSSGQYPARGYIVEYEMPAISEPSVLVLLLGGFLSLSISLKKGHPIKRFH